ncbi:hypothetical protein BGS_1184 [Beggiatoa sp. SS]|nr:hypothetical protein BGS_1184 [Beggiatoa sp. SS]
MNERHVSYQLSVISYQLSVISYQLLFNIATKCASGRSVLKLKKN